MYFDEIELGMSVDTAPAVIKKEKMLEFARDYDNVPLHTDEKYAESTPFGKLIAPGVMSFMSVWAKYLEVDFFGEELLAGKSTKIEWLKPVFAEDVLTGKATITNLVKRSEKTVLLKCHLIFTTRTESLYSRMLLRLLSDADHPKAIEVKR